MVLIKNGFKFKFIYCTYTFRRFVNARKRKIQCTQT